MPANLPPQYYELEREFKAENDPAEKLRMARELLRIMPKHKGTDKLQADMKAKISKLKKQVDAGQKKHGATQATAFDHIPREGAAQLILIGPPNSGKSSLVDALTGAEPLVADYPYSTREPLTGMLEFETIQLQLIDTPPISNDMFEGYMNNLVRQADLVVFVADLEDPKMEENTKMVLDLLEQKRVILKPEESEEEPEDVRVAVKKTIVVAHKEYEDESGEKRAKLESIFPDFKIYPTSILDEDSLKALCKGMFDALGIIRVYTKQVGHDVEFKDPIILSIGGTVEEAARSIHKDFAHKLKFARVWGEGHFDGQRVQGDYVLGDRDIIEFHI